MPLVQNAQNAINIGDSFIQRYHFYKTLQSCSRTEAEWVLLYNVGILDEEWSKLLELPVADQPPIITQ